MAAPTYATDLLTYNDCTSLTGWAEPTGMVDLDGAGNVDSDLAIYGTVCITEAMRKTTLGALVFTGTQPTWTAGETCYFVWFKWFAPNSLDTKANGGMRLLVGSTSANYRGWYVGGSNTYAYGGWLNWVVDPTQTALATQTQGSPTTTYNTVGFGVRCPTSTPSKGNSFNIDIIRYGRGEIRFTNGDLANGYATFNGLALVNDNPTTGRWGLFQDVGGAYLWKGLMSLGLTGTAVDFRDSNKVINIDNTEMVATNFNRIEVNNASSNVEWNAINISSLGTRAPGEFEMIANAAVTQSACTFTDMSTFVYQSNATCDAGTTWRRCGQITQGSATIANCLIDKTTAASAILADNASIITGTEFISDGSSHAVEIASAGSYSWTNNTVSGYETSNGTTGNEVIYNNTGGQVTINVSGGSGIVTYHNGGASTTTINSTVGVTVTGLKENTEVRVLAFGTNTELAGIENATAGVSGSREFTFSLSATTSTTIKIHSLLYEHISIDYVVPSSPADLPVQQRFDRNYLNPL